MAEKSKAKVQDKASSKETKPPKSTGKDAKKSPKKAQKKDNIFKRMFTYFNNVRLEIKRTTWPTRSEVLNMTIIVVIALLFFGVLIFIVDRVMVVLVELLSQLKIDATASDAEEPAQAVSLFIQQFLMGGK